MEELKLGGIYQDISDYKDLKKIGIDAGRKPMRIIGLDAVEVFYDALWSDNHWIFSGNFRRRVFFYRMRRNAFLKMSKLIKIVPLTSEEDHFFRPDLPMRFGRTKAFSWNAIESGSLGEFRSALNAAFSETYGDQIVQTKQIVLTSQGPKKSLKKGIIVEADNGQYFTITELLWKAKQIQEAQNINISNGIGIYRLGFEKGLPSYYIGDYIDQGGIYGEN